MLNLQTGLATKKGTDKIKKKLHVGNSAANSQIFAGVDPRRPIADYLQIFCLHVSFLG